MASLILDTGSIPIFGTVTDDAGHGGIARVSVLVQRALRNIYGEDPVVIRLLPRGSDDATIVRRARFAIRMRVASRNAGWALYDHAGLARANRRNVPYALFVHGIEAWNPELDRYAAAIRGADLLLAVSNHTAQRVADVHGVDPSRIEVLHLALAPQSASAGIADAAVVDRIATRSVGIVGRISSGERHKGHDELLEAFRELRHLDGAQLVIVGGGDDLERLKARASDLGIVDRVLFTGRVSEATLQSIYTRLRIFAMPSRGEGFGLVYLEAMRHGLPCIASVHDAAKEVVVDGTTGMTIDLNDAKALRRALELLLTDDALCARMGAAGKEREEAAFSFQRFEDRLGEILRARRRQLPGRHR